MSGWRRIGSGVLASLLVGLSFPIPAGAESSLVGEDRSVVRGNEVCGVSVRGLAYADADELEKNGFVYGKDFTYDGSKKMYVPEKQEIRDSVGKMMLTLQMYGADVNQIVDDRLRYSIVRADMKNILGHAFVWQDTPEIYLYGKYIDFWEGVETEATIVHEFGHYVEAKYMSDLDRRIAYGKLRGLPKEMVYSTQDGAAWEDLFEEIFAEDYKSLFVDGSLYKANQKPLSASKREKLLGMIVGWMVEDMDPSKESSGDLGMLRNSGFVSDEDVLFCTDQVGSYLGEGVGGSELVNWLIEMYYGKSERVGNMLTTKDVDRAVFKSYGFYPSDVDSLSRVQYRAIISYFSNDVTRYVRSREDARYKRSVASASRIVPSRYESYTKSVLGSANYFGMLTQSELKTYKGGRVTRGEMARLLVRAKGVNRVSYAEARRILKNYRDVDVRSGYGRDVATVIKYKWMFGVKKGSFGYKNVMSKEQVAYLIAKAYPKSATYAGSKPMFNDARDVSKRYVGDVMRLRKIGVLVGDAKGKFNPKYDVSRTQVFGMLTRMVKKNRDYNVRELYGRDRLLGVYGTQDKLRRVTGTKEGIRKKDVIKWMK